MKTNKPKNKHIISINVKIQTVAKYKTISINETKCEEVDVCHVVMQVNFAQHTNMITT